MQVIFLFLLNSHRSFLTSLALHYDAFERLHRGVKRLSLQMSKPSQSMFSHLCAYRDNPQFLFKLQVSNSIHNCVTAHSKVFFTGQHSAISYNKAGLITTRFYLYSTISFKSLLRPSFCKLKKYVFPSFWYQASDKGLNRHDFCLSYRFLCCPLCFFSSFSYFYPLASSIPLCSTITTLYTPLIFPRTPLRSLLPLSEQFRPQGPHLICVLSIFSNIQVFLNFKMDTC